MISSSCGRLCIELVDFKMININIQVKGLTGYRLSVALKNSLRVSPQTKGMIIMSRALALQALAKTHSFENLSMRILVKRLSFPEWI